MPVLARLHAPIAACAFTLVLALLGGCVSYGGSVPPSSSPSPFAAPSPVATPTPVPTPEADPVASPEDAAARVIATDPRFAGATPLSPDLIGASKWWEATALPGGGYSIILTLGWGDCPAGCIERHTWTFTVAADGTVTPTGETGDPVPTNL